MRRWLLVLLSLANEEACTVPIFLFCTPTDNVTHVNCVPLVIPFSRLSDEYQIVLQLLPFLQNRCTKNAPWQISVIRDEKMWVFDDNNNALTFWCNKIHLSMKALKSWSYSILYLSLRDFAHKLPILFMFKVDCYPEIISQKENIDSNAKSNPRLSDFNAIFFENLPGKCSK